MSDGDWFAPRRFGYGSGPPLRWQGWGMLGAMVAALLLATRLEGGMRWVAVVAIVAVAAPVMAGRTRGGWKWRRGSDAG